MVINRDKEVSDNLNLWVAPPGFFLIIWPVIYTGLILANLYNMIKNVWNLKTHIFFGITNTLNIIWIIIVYGIASDTAVIISSFILIVLTIFIYFTWVEIGNIPEKDFTIFTYIVRNIFAFYLGWCIAGSNLYFGTDIVYWWGGTKEQQMIVFWVMAPLCALGVFGYICWRYGKKEFSSCFCLWLSVSWAFVGAAISTNKCITGDC